MLNFLHKYQNWNIEHNCDGLIPEIHRKDRQFLLP